MARVVPGSHLRRDTPEEAALFPDRPITLPAHMGGEHHSVVKEQRAKLSAAEIEAQLKTLSTGEAAGQSWRDHGAIIIAPLGEAPALVDRLAPEHVEFAVADPDALAERVRHVGAMFLGRWTPEAIGDYVAGSNHVLPTSRAARFSSGLSLYDFIKRTSIVKCDERAFAALGPATVALAESEGLPAHARSAALRLGQTKS